ncbi:MAG: relaxase/mobilization nuclease domain-containing protein [Clostridia bacterium]|nr:relaxase/mobilization nuclease domain-containing protein [Clostridia bacterium]
MAVYKVINSSKAVNTHGGMKNCLRYVFADGKTAPELCYVIGSDNAVNDPLRVYRDFIRVKKEFGKDIGRQYIHAVLSFAPGENITPEEALDFGIDFADKVYPGHQCAVAVHTDKDHIHCHMVINTVSYLDGRKSHKSKKDLQKDKDVCNRMCEERGLTVNVKGEHFDGTPQSTGDISSWDKDTYKLLSQNTKKSYLAECGIAVMKAMKASTDKDGFIRHMKEYGWQVQWTDNRKHIVFINADGKKVRDTNLRQHLTIIIRTEKHPQNNPRKSTILIFRQKVPVFRVSA